jgi:hypothetical protein
MRAELKWVVGLNIFEICLMNADGTNLVQPTDNALREATGTWSADGQKVKFQSPEGANPTHFMRSMQTPPATPVSRSLLRAYAVPASVMPV